MGSTLFFFDPKTNERITAETLIIELARASVYNPYVYSSSFYKVFFNIVLSLALGKEIILLDSDFSHDEIIKLVGDAKLISNSNQIINPIGINNIDELFSLIEKNKDNWKITLYTSGTTGAPKKITHSFESISRFVKTNNKFKLNVWGFAYNPTHMAGLQVFLQAFFNRNPIIRLFGLDRNIQLDLINEFSVTNISATPTFYRLLLPADRVCSSVLRLTSGGEKFDPSTLSSLAVMFPNAKVTNVYASTEAGTLFGSTGNNFIIKESMQNLVKVLDGELLLHKSLMGQSESFVLEGDWYKTGDLVEVLKEEPLTIRFLARKNEMINVGGYKVNPSEVEEVICSIPEVKDAYVFAKANRLLGNVICCEVITLSKDLSEKTIRDVLTTKLQEYKIPRIIKFVDSISTTRTGKKERKK